MAPNRNKVIEGTGLKQVQAIRLHTALVALVEHGRVVIDAPEVAKYAQVSESAARVAMGEWQRQGWLEMIDSNGLVAYVITEQCPSAPSAGAIEVIGLLQVVNRSYYEMHWLTFGYGSALAFHGEAELVQHAYYIFHSDQTVTPPKLPPNAPFRRSTKSPTQWGTWRGRPVYYMRRHPDAMKPYQRTEVSYQGARVPVTSLLRTLIDCWLRPDLCGGEDRMVDAWQHYLENNQSRLAAVRREMIAIVKDSLWPSAAGAFTSWLALMDSYFETHPIRTSNESA